jgi:hypothetical protein
MKQALRKRVVAGMSDLAQSGETETERRQRRDDLLTYGDLAARVIKDRPDTPQHEEEAAPPTSSDCQTDLYA